jgi:hypothetical protein
MVNHHNDYTPSSALLKLGVTVRCKTFIGVELVRANVQSQFPYQSKFGYYGASQNDLPLLILAPSMAPEWPMIEMGSDMRQSTIGPVESLCTRGPV